MPTKFNIDIKETSGTVLNQLWEMRTNLREAQLTYEKSVRELRSVRAQIAALEQRKTGQSRLSKRELSKIELDLTKLKQTELDAIAASTSRAKDFIQAQTEASVGWSELLRGNGYDITLNEARSFVKVDTTLNDILDGTLRNRASAASDSQLLNDMSELYELIPGRVSSLLKALSVKRVFETPALAASAQRAQELGVKDVWTGQIDADFLTLCDGLVTEQPVLREGGRRFTTATFEPLRKGIAKAALVEELRNRQAEALQVVRDQAINPEEYKEFMKSVAETSMGRFNSFFSPEGERGNIPEDLKVKFNQETELVLDKMLKEEIVPAIERYVLKITPQDTPIIPSEGGATGGGDRDYDIIDEKEFPGEGEAREEFIEDHRQVEAVTFSELFR